jgi:protocatechuate 3,4-dioxygenase beta subunit
MLEPLNRRTVLRFLATSGGAVVFSSCGGSTGSSADATPAPDADPSLPDGAADCRPTTGDAQGPFFESGAPMRSVIAEASEPGERMWVDVEVLAEGCDSAAAGVLVDIWQADSLGAYHDASRNYRLRGQVVTPADGRFRVETIRPGNYEQGPGLWRPAHVHFMFSHPDYQSVTTQLYFAGDPYLPPNDSCTSCNSEDTDRVMALTADGAGVLRGSWRVVLLRT